MTQEKTLHELYQLLWEQIKDKKIIKSLVYNTSIMYKEGKINTEEMLYLDYEILENIQGYYTSKTKKAFVLRMIEETKNN